MENYRKVEHLTDFYNYGHINEFEYWEMRAQVEMPDVIRRRTILAKPLGLLAKELHPFQIYAYSKIYLQGNADKDIIDKWKHQAKMNKIERLKMIRKAKRLKFHVAELRNLKGVN